MICPGPRHTPQPHETAPSLGEEVWPPSDPTSSCPPSPCSEEEEAPPGAPGRGGSRSTATPEPAAEAPLRRLSPPRVRRVTLSALAPPTSGARDPLASGTAPGERAPCTPAHSSFAPKAHLGHRKAQR